MYFCVSRRRRSPFIEVKRVNLSVATWRKKGVTLGADRATKERSAIEVALRAPSGFVSNYAIDRNFEKDAWQKVATC